MTLSPELWDLILGFGIILVALVAVVAHKRHTQQQKRLKAVKRSLSCPALVELHSQRALDACAEMMAAFDQTPIKRLTGKTPSLPRLDEVDREISPASSCASLTMSPMKRCASMESMASSASSRAWGTPGSSVAASPRALATPVGSGNASPRCSRAPSPRCSGSGSPRMRPMPIDGAAASPRGGLAEASPRGGLAEPPNFTLPPTASRHPETAPLSSTFPSLVGRPSAEDARSPQLLLGSGGASGTEARGEGRPPPHLLVLGDAEVGKSSVILTLESFAVRSRVELRVEEGPFCLGAMSRAELLNVAALVVWDASMAQPLSEYIAKHLRELIDAVRDDLDDAEEARLLARLRTRLLVLCNKCDVQPCPLPEIASLGDDARFLAGSALKGTNMRELWRYVETCAAPRGTLRQHQQVRPLARAAAAPPAPLEPWAAASRAGASTACQRQQWSVSTEMD